MTARSFRIIALSSLLLPVTDLIAQWQSVGVAGSAYGIEAHNGALFAGNLGLPIQRSTDHGDTWTDANTGITVTSNWWLSSAQGILFCGTQFGAAFRSTDDGATWENIGLLGAARGFIEHNDTLYACQWYSGGVDFSTDGGATWQDTDTLIGANGLWPMISVNGDLLVGGQTGGVRRITRSTDAWTSSNSGLVNTEVYSFTRVGDILFAGLGSGGGVYRSDDFGTTWTASGLDGNIVYALHAMDTLLFAGTANAGVHMSSDSGATWTAFNTGLNDLEVARLTSDGVYLYAGTLGGGVNRYGISTGLDGSRERPVGVSAFPVPCATTFTTVVQLSGVGEVTAQLVSVTGQVVAEQRVLPMSAGARTLTWDVTTLAPGVYICRVVAGGRQGMVRVVVQR
ncbi:MAG: T9SS type A sorting domain-containing protein [Flavobacteriales bacterium]|nr:T9SS type A sorting domain-containing protein [Flavobacteriales bacterium]